MGIGGGIFLITIGAILAFAVHSRVNWIDIKAAGVVLMLAGVALLVLTLWLWNDRRRRMERQSEKPPPGPQPGSAEKK